MRRTTKAKAAARLRRYKLCIQVLQAAMDGVKPVWMRERTLGEEVRAGGRFKIRETGRVFGQ